MTKTFRTLTYCQALMCYRRTSEKENSNATEEERSSKKRTFANVENEELDSIVENAQPKNNQAGNTVGSFCIHRLVLLC